MKLKLATTIVIIALSICGKAATERQTNKGGQKTEKINHYCEYCGHRFPTVKLLTSATCPRHPDGSNRGRHKLYEGTEKKEYTCKHCGKKFPSIMVMAGGTCPNHPKGANKGSHAPAL